MADATITFNQDDLVLTWDYNKDNDKVVSATLVSYKVESWAIYDETLPFGTEREQQLAGLKAVSTFTVTPNVDKGGTFTYTKVQNTLDFDTARRKFILKLYSFDSNGDYSFAFEVEAEHPQRTAPTITVTSPSPTELHVNIKPTGEDNVAGYLLYTSTVQGFTPGLANQISDSTDLSQIFSGLSAGEVWYVRCAAYDSFGKDNLVYSAEVASKTQVVTAPTTFVASGIGHKGGLVPDPGAVAGTTKFLCEDATFKVPSVVSPLTTKGDLYIYSTTDDRLPVGTNGYVLTADSTQTSGLKWDVISYGGLTLTAQSVGFTIAGGTTSKTLTINNTLTFSGTDSSTLNIGSGGTLGTAAYTASTAYATSSQGTKADNVAAVNGIIKCNGSGTFSAASAGTDYAPASITQTSKSAAYTFVLGDANQAFLHPAADTTARTWTVPANSSVAYPVGTTIILVNESGAGAITISITTDTMVLVPTGSTGNRTLAAPGHATLYKVTSTKWHVYGANLT